MSRDALEKERKATQELLAERDRLAAENERLAEERLAEGERLAEEKHARMMEEERAQNDAGHMAIYELLVVSYSCIFSQSMQIMFVPLLANMTDSSKTNVQTMCEKTDQTAPPMQIINPVGTVSFISMITSS